MVVNDALMTLISITKKAFLPPFVALISVHLVIQDYRYKVVMGPPTKPWA